MPSGFHNWSQTVSSNASSDTAIGWAEGQSPSSVNDSARAMMAVLAKYRDDISGAIVTGGTSTAYTVATYTVFSSLALLNNQVIAFTPHTTNGATVTLNVDGLGAKPLRAFPSVELQSNSLIAGTPYVAIYSNADAAFYLQGNAGGTYGIPLGGGMPFFLATAPSSAFVFPYGQAISRTTYATLFSAMGTTYGTGDGSTTFNIPDLRGRMFAAKDDMGGSAASRITTAGGAVDGATLGAVGGAQNVTLITANLPAYTPAGTITNGTITMNGTGGLTAGGSSNRLVDGDTPAGQPNSQFSFTQATSTFTGTAQGGTSTAVKTLPPTIVGNFILRII